MSSHVSNEQIASAAENFEHHHGQISYAQMDCSHFVTSVLRSLDRSFEYMQANDFPYSRFFRHVDHPDRGDIIQWHHSPHGHVGIVLNASAQEFIGSQSSTGVEKASYGHGYWARHGTITFLRYVG